MTILSLGSLVRSRRPTSDSVLPIWAALLRTAAGLVLFDTGAHPVHASRPDATFGPEGPHVRMGEEDGIVRRLAEVGVRPEEVTIVVNSHLHFDHAGNNGAFPRATFVVQAAQLAYAKSNPRCAPLYWDLPGLHYLALDGEAAIAPGLRVVPTPGHVPGHQSLVVDLDSTGRVVLCGGAADRRDDFASGLTSADDQRAAGESLALIRSLVDDDLSRVFPGHDLPRLSSPR